MGNWESLALRLSCIWPTLKFLRSMLELEVVAFFRG